MNAHAIQAAALRVYANTVNMETTLLMDAPAQTKLEFVAVGNVRRAYQQSRLFRRTTHGLNGSPFVGAFVIFSRTITSAVRETIDFRAVVLR